MPRTIWNTVAVGVYSWPSYRLSVKLREANPLREGAVRLRELEVELEVRRVPQECEPRALLPCSPRSPVAYRPAPP